MRDILLNFRLSDKLLGRYERLVCDTVIPYQERVLRDDIPGVDKSHAIANFAAAAETIRTGVSGEGFYGMVFQDSDVAKWLEAAAYSLRAFPDPDLEARCDDVIRIIGEAQYDDGYLNTYFTVKEPDKKWTNLAEAHELYCAGHMIEAAVAYALCTGKEKLLNIMRRMADHIYDRFITNGAEGYPGHPEIELALMRLYDYTGDDKYLKLSGHFINCRGVNPGFFSQENDRKGWRVWGTGYANSEYSQSHAPVREQKDAVGHAVRAVYLYAGMARYARATGDDSLKNACETLWNSITRRRMYVTGAIGSAYEGESFTKDYHLPNDTAYNETCASIGLIFFASGMLELHKDSKYADVMERALYNCVLAGISLDGTRFFYVNPLEVIPGISGAAQTHRHALPQRPGWFECACCPPNAARLLSSVGAYAWSVEDSTVFSHLYIGGTLDLADTLGGTISIHTDYPYGGNVKYSFSPLKDAMRMTLAIRLPDWSARTSISLNGKNADYSVENGYAYLSGDFTGGDIVELSLDMSVMRVYSSLKVGANSGKTAFSRGPLIYCAEGIDNDGSVLDVFVKRTGACVAEPYDSETLEGIVKIIVDGYRAVSDGDTLYSHRCPELSPCKLTLIPYYAWGNRGLNEMRVWIPEAE